MSVPARATPVPARGDGAPRRATGVPARGGAVPAPKTAGGKQAPPSRPAAPATPRARARRRGTRRFHAAFWGMSAAITTTIVVALVSVSALVVETGFGIDRTEARIAALREQGESLRRDVAEMSAPGRIAHWAKRKGLEMPEAPVVVLQVPGGASEADPGTGTPAGGSDG